MRLAKSWACEDLSASMSAERDKILQILNEDLSPWTFKGDEPMAARLCEVVDSLTSRIAAIREMAEVGLHPAMGKASLGPYGTLEAIKAECDEALRNDPQIRKSPRL
jgi:hypothetical protein